jgi:mRNA interferase RelE/StbE
MPATIAFTLQGSRLEIRFYRSARRELNAIEDAQLRAEITATILALAEDPTPPGSLELEDAYRLYRIRIGGWRVVYALSENARTVLITRVRPRGSAYVGL